MYETRTFLSSNVLMPCNSASLSFTWPSKILRHNVVTATVYVGVLRHFARNVRRTNADERQERTAPISKELFFETTLFLALFSRLSVTTWRTIRFPCSCRTRVARCFLRGPPFVAWANVFYSIKQTRYLVGKLVRTQRCVVGP